MREKRGKRTERGEEGGAGCSIGRNERKKSDCKERGEEKIAKHTGWFMKWHRAEKWDSSYWSGRPNTILPAFSAMI